MKDYKIASRYARALFEIGEDLGDETLDRLNIAMDQMVNAISATPSLAAVLHTPVLDTERKKKLLSAVSAVIFDSRITDSVRRLVKNFVCLLADRKRLSLLPTIRQTFAMMLDERRHVVRGTLCTAVVLSPERLAAIRKQLEDSLKSSLVLEHKVEPSILGGLTLRLGDRVLDASLRTQLETLRDTIRKGE